jgi:hypothetical protein
MTIQLRALAAGVSVALSAACAAPSSHSTSTGARSISDTAGAIAQIYYWRARPGKLQEYNRYIREVAEPIDAAARRRGAFVSVTTYVAHDTTVPWTHMRIFILRDTAQLLALGPALDAAGARLEPDSVKRRLRGEYAATLRDRVGQTTARVLR